MYCYSSRITILLLRENTAFLLYCVWNVGFNPKARVLGDNAMLFFDNVDSITRRNNSVSISVRVQHYIRLTDLSELFHCLNNNMC
jgi:hypothetical protein